MRIPAVWLREFVSVPEDRAELEAFCDRLTMVGLEVEEILDTPIGPTLYTKITPNRGDWASVYGTAREAGALGDGEEERSEKREARRPNTPFHASVKDPTPDTQHPVSSLSSVSIRIEDAENCPRYAAKLIRGVKIGPTPEWMQQRLSAALGDKYRPINNVADITNYVMLELGQPLHAFDYDTIPGGEIVVRQAQPGETIKTLDQLPEEQPRRLAPGMLCICDRERPIAVAGIMGGADTEISDSTVNILLEAAHFDPLSVRRTSKRLGLKTEAAYRFERYVDPNLVAIAAERAAQLIVAIAGGEAVPGLFDVVAKKTLPRRVLARMDRIRYLLGVDVDRDAAISALERLGISVERSATALDCGIPPWRPDLTIEDDIAEEVGRIALGYENLPETMPPVWDAKGGDSRRGRFITLVRETLVRAGLQEVQSHSLVAPSALWVSATERRNEETQVLLRAPRAPEYSALRTSLVPNHITIAARALRDGIRDMALFEVGSVYQKADAGEYTEPLRVSGLAAGSAMPPVWAIKPDAHPVDIYFVKGVVEELLAALGIPDVAFVPGTHPATHSGRTATVLSGSVVLGLIAELSETTVIDHDLPRRTYIFDLDGDLLMQLAADVAVNYKPLPKFPAIVRDLAPVFADSVPYAEIEQVAERSAGPLLESLRLTDVYTGANLGNGKRSLTLRFTFRSSERTLKDTEIEAALSAVRTALTTIGGDFRA